MKSPRRISPRSRSCPRPPLRRAGAGRAHGDAGAAEAGDRGPARQRPQAPGDLRRDRPLRHRRGRRGHRLPPGQARAEISRLGQGGRDVRGRLQRPRLSHCRPGIVQGAGQEHASGDREQEPATDARLPRDAGRRSVRRAGGHGGSAAGGISRLQGRARGMRRVRRGHQLPARGGARWPHSVPRRASGSPTTALFSTIVPRELWCIAVEKSRLQIQLTCGIVGLPFP